MWCIVYVATIKSEGNTSILSSILLEIRMSYYNLDRLVRPFDLEGSNKRKTSVSELIIVRHEYTRMIFAHGTEGNFCRSQHTLVKLMPQEHLRTVSGIEALS